MIDMMKRIMYTGVGLALNTKAEVEAWGKELIEKGKMSEQDGREFLEDLSSRYDKARSDPESRIETIVKNNLVKADVASRSEIEEIKKEIAELRKVVGSKDESAGTP